MKHAHRVGSLGWWRGRIVMACLLALATVPSGSPRLEAAQDRLDLFDAVIVIPLELGTPEKNAVDMLIDEVAARSFARWAVQHSWPEDNVAVVALGPRSKLEAFAGRHASAFPATVGSDQAEGYHLKAVGNRSAPTVLVVGNDPRGVLFGCGRLLRELYMTREAVELAADIDIETAPRTALRGHQLGFRPKVNSYDGWTVPMWEQYYRDLIVFGTNAVELIPPRSDDADLSPHFPLPKIDMMAAMSQLAKDYALDLWIWYPALDRDYSRAKTVDFALREWAEIFRRLPHIDVVFVPGGDPGHTHPEVLFDLLEKQCENLHRYHPDAEIWMSPQSFGAEWTEVFYKLMDEEPEWLSGIAFAPQNFVGLPALRERVPARYPIRRYPDITHSIHCQYAVPRWDPAYALTENREVINPRPTQYAHVFRLWNKYSFGFLTYSEGCNDDVNKIVWSGLGWDPETDVVEILRDYSRYFIGVEYEDDFAQGLLALEQNWVGPLLTNGTVDTTFEQFRAMLDNASPQIKLKWRFQQAVYRAHYDAYNRLRLLSETALEKQALDQLRNADRLGAETAMERAEAILKRAVTEPVAQDVRARIFEMAEALYQSIRMQHSVPRYQAIRVRRGGNLDLVDFPLNDREWLNAQFDAIRQIDTEQARLGAIEKIVNWTNPGPGGFYDDLGRPGHQPHLVYGKGWEADPEFRHTARLGVHAGPAWRMSWIAYAESRYDAPLKVAYDHLDPDAQYVVKVTYAGDRRKTRIRLVADGRYRVHDYLEKPLLIEPVQFDVPKDATADGRLTLIWNQAPGSRGSGRGTQIAEVWLMKK